MSAYKIQTPGNYPEESIQQSEHGESLKSGMDYFKDQNMHQSKKLYSVVSAGKIAYLCD
jgi:hypothetical protein